MKNINITKLVKLAPQVLKSNVSKTFLLILLTLGLNNAFADTNQTTTNTTNYKIGVTDSTAWYLSLQCYPSGWSMSLKPTSTAYCDTGDTDVYVGRFGTGSMTQDELNSITVQNISSQKDGCTGYHYMQNNHAWHIHLATIASTNIDNFTKVYMQVSGDPEITVDGCWNSDDI